MINYSAISSLLQDVAFAKARHPAQNPNCLSSYTAYVMLRLDFSLSHFVMCQDHSSISPPIMILLCGDFQLNLVVNSTHNFVTFPSASGLRKVHSQDGNVQQTFCCGVLWE